MITKIIIKKFKKLDAELELDSSVVFVGPNNSGKTSALQAIYFWAFGLKKWYEQKGTGSNARKRTGAVINRKDIYNIPVPSLKQIWKDIQVRKSNNNIKIEIIVEGIINNTKWKVGLKFDYANQETCYVKPVETKKEIIDLALKEQVVLLPPMSGLTAEEYKLEPGTINIYLGQGKTADVIRNLCWYVYSNKKDKWDEIVHKIDEMFAVKFNDPEFSPDSGKIIVTYKEKNNEYDIINCGRGVQQVLLILTYIHFNPGSIVLIDEPDAHLEILRQKQIFNLLQDILTRENSQLIIATHSEALLNEAIQKSKIIAFIGKPHIVNSTSQVSKSLTTIGIDQYLLAEQKGWVIYLEGATDLSLLRSFAKLLKHPVYKYLETPFVNYIGNVPKLAKDHFYGLKEAYKDLKGIALFDNIDKQLRQDSDLLELMWERREIENYIPLPETLKRFFEKQIDIFSSNDLDIINEIISAEVPPAALNDKTHDFWVKTKISDDFLDKVLKKFAERKNIPILISKKDYYILLDYAKSNEIDKEVKEKLDLIYQIAKVEDKK